MVQNPDEPPLHELSAFLQSEAIAAPALQGAEAGREAIEVTKPHIIKLVFSNRTRYVIASQARSHPETDQRWRCANLNTPTSAALRNVGCVRAAKAHGKRTEMISSHVQYSEWRNNGSVVLSALAGIMLSATHSYSLGVMMVPLEQEFGWSRSEISTGPLITSIIAMAGAPLMGVAVDRLGPRRLALFGVPAYCAMLAALSLATPSIFSWWALWSLLALTAMFVIPTLWTAAIASYFDRNRGMAFAIALCGTSLCALATPPLTNFYVSAFGWRVAYLLLGGTYLLLVLPLAWLFLRSAVDDLRNARTESKGASIEGMSLREGVRSRAFLCLAAALVAFALAMCALTTNAVPILIAQGLSPAEAAAIAGTIGLGSLAGRLGGGFLLDHVDARKLAAASVLMPVAAVIILFFVPGSVNAALIAAFLLGLAAGTEVDACAYLTARHFGMKSFGALFGALNGILIFSNGIAPLLSNAIYDHTGNYDVFLIACAPTCGLAALLFLAMGPYPERYMSKDDDASAATSPA